MNSHFIFPFFVNIEFKINVQKHYTIISVYETGKYERSNQRFLKSVTGQKSIYFLHLSYFGVIHLND
jgi:hypothetical protein